MCHLVLSSSLVLPSVDSSHSHRFEHRNFMHMKFDLKGHPIFKEVFLKKSFSYVQVKFYTQQQILLPFQCEGIDLEHYSSSWYFIWHNCNSDWKTQGKMMPNLEITFARPTPLNVMLCQWNTWMMPLNAIYSFRRWLKSTVLHHLVF